MKDKKKVCFRKQHTRIDEKQGMRNSICLIFAVGENLSLRGYIMFFDGNTELTVNASTGLYTMKNGATFGLEYDKSEGVLKLTDYYQKDGKGATVKVKLMFPGQVKQITKIFVIKTK